MTRKGFCKIIADTLYSCDCSKKYTDYSPEADGKVCRILRVMDEYIASEVLKNKELEVNKIDLKGQPLLPTPTCPGCGSKDYVVTGGPGGNCKCNRCGRNYFFCFSSSYGIK